MKCTIGAPLCPINAGAGPKLFFSLMQGECMPRGIRYRVIRTAIYSTTMAIRRTSTDRDTLIHIKDMNLLWHEVDINQGGGNKMYLALSFVLPLKWILKTCKAMGQDNKVIKATPPTCKYGAVTWIEEVFYMKNSQICLMYL